MATIDDCERSVVIELYGVPRLRAGRRECRVQATNVAEAIVALERECPALAGSVIANGQLLSAYRLSLNGQQFVTDPATRLEPGDSLVLIAADAGG
jgi:molybdopterin converting factor small subunit